MEPLSIMFCLLLSVVLVLILAVLISEKCELNKSKNKDKGQLLDCIQN